MPSRKPLNTLRGIETQIVKVRSRIDPGFFELENPSTPSGVLKRGLGGLVLSHVLFLSLMEDLENPSTPSGVLKRPAGQTGECLEPER